MESYDIIIDDIANNYIEGYEIIYDELNKEIDYKVYLIRVMSENSNIPLATFKINPPDNDEFYKRDLIKLKNILYTNEDMVMTVARSYSGYIAIEKKDNYLSFVVNKGFDDFYGECRFTVKITSKIMVILDTLIEN